MSGNSLKSVAALALSSAAAFLFLPKQAIAHDKLGANLNFIGDFRRNHEFVDVVKQWRRFLKIGQFDDTNADNTDACLDTCEAASCGDGFVQTGVETCDDGNLDDTDACPSTCETASCGDGFVQAGVEDCDDANAVNTDAWNPESFDDTLFVGGDNEHRLPDK